MNRNIDPFKIRSLAFLIGLIIAISFIDLSFINSTFFPTFVNAQSTETHQERLNRAQKLFIEGFQLYQKGQYKEAIPLVEASLDIVKVEENNSYDLLKVHPYNLLGILYKETGEYDKAEPLLLSCIKELKKYSESDYNVEYNPAAAENSLGLVYVEQGKYRKAEEYFNESLRLFTKLFGDKDINAVTVLGNLGLLYTEMGDYEKAEPRLIRSLQLVEQMPKADKLTLAAVNNNLGRLYQYKGDYEKADPLYEKALSFFEGKNNIVTAKLFNNLGDFYTLSKKYEKAEDILNRALKIYEKEVGPNHILNASVYNNLGLLSREKGDYEKARIYYEKALKISEDKFGEEHQAVAIAAANLGSFYFYIKNYEKAEPYLLRSQKTIETIFGKDHPLNGSFCSNLAICYFEMEDYKKTIYYLSRANESRELDFLHNLSTGSEKQKNLYIGKDNGDKDLMLSLHLNHAPDNIEVTREAMIDLIRGKGRVLDISTDTVSIIRKNGSKEDKQVLEQLIDTRQQLSQLALQGPVKEKETLADYQKRLKQLTDEAEKLEATLSEHSLSFRARLTPVTLDGVQKTIPKDAVLIEFTTYAPYDHKNRKFDDEHYVAYLLNHEGTIRFVDLGSVKIIDDSVAEFRKVLNNGANSSTQRLDKELYYKARSIDKLVMAPIRRLLDNKTALLISPDGALNLVPFDAFIDEQGNYLIENYHITYLTSGRDLLRLQYKTKSIDPPLIIADPDYGIGKGPLLGDVQYKPLPQLTQALAEAQEIGKIFPQAKLFSAEKATKDLVVGTNSPYFLHISTHGFFLEKDLNTNKNINNRYDNKELVHLKQDPLITDPKRLKELRLANPLLRSWLFFAEANIGNASAATLTALETAGLNLFGTKLVVLSACDTGIGDVKNGDGVYGLRRALVLAGTETQLVSLWSVNAKGTQDLMIDYYQQLKGGEGRGEALRKVALKFLHGKKLKYRHPYYWASFILSGEWSPLEK